jgi:hypothetical protein
MRILCLFSTGLSTVFSMAPLTCIMNRFECSFCLSMGLLQFIYITICGRVIIGLLEDVLA